MSRVCQLASFLAFIFAVSVAWSAEENDGTKQSDAKPTSVEMKSISYDPKSVEVPVGGSIVWTNKAFTNHTATSEDDGKTFRKSHQITATRAHRRYAHLHFQIMPHSSDQGDGQSAPASTQALMRTPNSCCVPGTGARPTPGCQPQPTSESSAMW